MIAIKIDFLIILQNKGLNFQFLVCEYIYLLSPDIIEHRSMFIYVATSKETFSGPFNSLVL